jgi:hypothetical protein
MTRVRAGVILLVIQLMLVLSIAGKYLYERMTRPRVWVRTTQFDPVAPLRGRYVAMQLEVDACDLPKTQATGGWHYSKDPIVHRAFMPGSAFTWTVGLDVVNGHLVPHVQDHVAPGRTFQLSLPGETPCTHARLEGNDQFFIPENAKTPLPLKPGQELWVEVTVPKKGPPRPIQLALSDASGFHPLTF